MVLFHLKLGSQMINRFLRVFYCNNFIVDVI